MSLNRVGNNQMTRQLLFHLKSQMSNQERLFEQISSNKRVLRPSDDPGGTSTIMGLQDQLAMLDEYDNVISSADVWTKVSYATLDSAVSTWTRAGEIAKTATDGTKTAADRSKMADEVDQLLSHMVQLSNTTHQNKYIFSGSETGTPPFRTEINEVSGEITGVFYEGNSQVRSVKTKDSGFLKIGILGSNAGNTQENGAFIDSRTGANAFNTLIELRDKLKANDLEGLESSSLKSDIETTAQNLVSSETRIGGAQEVLQLDRNRIIEETANVGQFLAEVEEADIAKLMLELNNVQNVYEAALASGGRLLQTGLLNFI